MAHLTIRKLLSLSRRAQAIVLRIAEESEQIVWDKQPDLSGYLAERSCVNNCDFTRSKPGLTMVLGTVALLLGCAVLASAQIETASLSGRVTDPTGAIIVGAQVEISNTETGIVNKVETSADGIYAAPSLKPGTYVMTVKKQGFRAVSVTGLTLNVQDNLVRNFVLQVGSSAESITVTAGGVALQTADSQLGTVVSEDAVA